MTNLRKILTSVALELQAKFTAASETHHKGGRGSTRQDDFARTLELYMPTKYSVGTGEISNSHSLVSKECDVVLYNAMAYPKIFASDKHAVFPIESVYGVIEVKSSLSKADLAGSFANAASIRKMVPEKQFAYISGLAVQSNLSLPLPVYGVFAYEAGRSQTVIAEQIRTLCEKHPAREWPDFIVCLSEGIYMLTTDPRSGMNKYTVAPGDAFGFYPAERLTFFRMYAKLLSALGKILLPPMNFAAYANRQTVMVGPYVVSSFSMWNPKEKKLMEYTEKGIRKILEFCAKADPVSLETAHKHETDVPLLAVPEDWKQPVVYEFNPTRKPPLPAALLVASAQAQLAQYADPNIEGPDTSAYFTPVKIGINGKPYNIDFGALIAEEDYKFTESLSSNEFEYGLHV